MTALDLPGERPGTPPAATIEALPLPCGDLILRDTVKAALRLPTRHPDRGVVDCRCGQRWAVEKSRDGWDVRGVIGKGDGPKGDAA